MLKHQSQIEFVLEKRLQQGLKPGSARLFEAMRYATLGGGKRLRALLVYATGQAMGAKQPAMDVAAAAVEMIHAYSLVHDDMPMMDDDDLRRGRPTCHKAYDEATALLVGDALQTQAFETLCDETLTDKQQSRMIKTLSHASGAAGMAGGQAIDLESVGIKLDIDALQAMHKLKTGALIRASVLMGALSAEQYDETILEHLDRYADCIGLAFQVQDDVLDVITDTETLGKAQGADIALNKPTYPALLGLEKAQQKAVALIEKALTHLDACPFNSEVLAELAQFVVKRSH
ncbi:MULTISPECIES: (2E,6E)-farnesyl diphosphate synthase [unclassified Methylophaga]|jgi:geranylgeranyl pyrophosphate synthase|uniref:(2E,6E)-farnesyl diphosphate synthase n=1 Tax=unclassified Methylophaga TaxID=2629249 RepID=UPI00259D20C7|nr:MULTISPECIES: farnesyl diphosphate synthase [unclassified Methylophaga]